MKTFVEMSGRIDDAAGQASCAAAWDSGASIGERHKERGKGKKTVRGARDRAAANLHLSLLELINSGVTGIGSLLEAPRSSLRWTVLTRTRALGFRLDCAQYLLKRMLMRVPELLSSEPCLLCSLNFFFLKKRKDERSGEQKKRYKIHA